MGFRGRNLTTLMMKMSKEHSKSKKSNRSPKSLADAAISEGRWESAVKFLSRAIEQDPGDHTLYLKRAKAYMEMGNFRFAIFAQPDAQRSCMIEPDQVEGYILFSKAAIANQELWGPRLEFERDFWLIRPRNV
jgi:predicted Zn-dependent protease